MKYIELKVIKGDENHVPMDYRAIIRSIASTPPNDGATIDVQRRQIRILDALEASENNTLVLEDADYQQLLALVRGYRGWTVVNRTIVEFADDLEAAPSDGCKAA